MFVYSSTCFECFPAHHQELNDCSGSLWFYLCIVVTVVLCSWSGRPARPRTLPSTQCKGDWVCLTAGPDSCGNSRPYRDMIAGRPTRTRNLLNPWSKVLLEKLTGLQLVKKFPAFYGTRRFITAFISTSRLSPHQSISPGPTQVYAFRNKASFHGEDLSTPRPTLMLDHPLSDVQDCLFNIFPAPLQIRSLSSIRNLYTLHDVVTGAHLSRRTHSRYSKAGVAMLFEVSWNPKIPKWNWGPQLL
jgi:hypothetical protein